MGESFEARKSDLVRLAQERMQSAIADNTWTKLQKLALTCRILFHMGHDSGLSGQITTRAEEPGTYYTQRLGLGFDEITEWNLLKVDEDLNVLEGGGMANPANRFHSWVYRARPDVNCIIHTHPPYVSALSMLEIPLALSHMDTCPLYEDCAFLPKWPGIPVGNEEGELIAGALGDKKALMLAHHGQLVACASVEEACVLAVLFERAARLQLLAMAAGDIKPVDELLAVEAHDWVSTPKRHQAAFAYYARRALRHGHDDCIDAAPPDVSGATDRHTIPIEGGV
ncbi:aldolase [Streptomyces spectabilis]|uniref:Aldolase n=1 Tax=Streptomyces spectabilis TaxID=68270 RepID=A0A5P2XG28_STRST|nr:aldolase [Streptomyces spectabilis]MBB5105401.1 L-fuculose-phosphate aldolase [Streptomyces spectabilis]MCI3906594.1 aldolase [Streptomyces spectabilis]QEV63418.1 aldolase [Streptomyces spectabilis]GGV21356.1 class II aldolase [Streptomyces spectabilis]